LKRFSGSPVPGIVEFRLKRARRQLAERVRLALRSSMQFCLLFIFYF
jgi:hypothetical protein